MFKIRLQFSKTGRAKFLSHLDTMRIFQRAITRTEIPVEYSQGFNPHMRISIALPLSLGVESVCEMIDIQLQHPSSGMADKLNAALPEGFQILGTLPLFDINTVTQIRYEMELSAEVPEIFDGRPLVIQKKTKRGLEPFDIAPHVTEAVCSGKLFNAVLSAHEPTINPTHVLAALQTVNPGIEMKNARRIEMINKDGE